MTLSIVPYDNFSEDEFGKKIENLYSEQIKGALDEKLLDFLSQEAYRLAKQNNKKLFLAVEGDEIIGYVFYKRVRFVETEYSSFLGENSLGLIR